MALTTAQYSTALADILAQFHAGTITEAEFDTAHVALLDQWVISNTDLATRVVDLVTRLDALVVEGEPDAGVGNIGSIAIDLDNQLVHPNEHRGHSQFLQSLALSQQPTQLAWPARLS